MTTDSNPNKEGHDMPACTHNGTIDPCVTRRGFIFKCRKCGKAPAAMRDDYGRFLAQDVDSGLTRGPGF